MKDLRDQFEEWYAGHMEEQTRVRCTPDEIKRLREGDSYGSGRTSLNGKWEGFRGARQTVPFPSPRAPVNDLFDAGWNACLESMK